MLKLEREDLVEGLLAWWPVLPGRKKRPLVVAWPDLVLIAPVLGWPKGLHPYRQDDWRGAEASFRFSWVPGLGRLVVQEDAPVLHLQACYDLVRAEQPRVTPMKHSITRGRVKLGCLEYSGGAAAYSDKRVLDRLRKGLGCRLADVDLRLASPDWSRRPVLLAYRHKSLRAVASALTEAEALGA